LFLNHVCFSQQTNIYHVVSKGETLSKIAQKYNLTPYDIIKLNPNAKNGVFEKDVLIIPKTDVDAQSTLLSSKNDKIATVKTEKNPNKLFHVV